MEEIFEQEDVRPRRNWYRIAGIMAAILATLFTAIFFSGRLLAPVVRKAVEEQFAVPVRMGDIRIRVFPGPSFRVDDLVIPGRHADTLLSAKTLFLRVQLMPLLRQRIVIPAVAISDARIRIDRTGSRPNYDDILAPSANRDTSEKYTLEISRILIENTTIIYLHSREKQVFTTLAAADIRWKDDGAVREIRPELFFSDSRITIGKDTLPVDRMAIYGTCRGNRYEGTWKAEGMTIRAGDLEYVTNALLREKQGKGWSFEEPEGHLEGPMKDLHQLVSGWLPQGIRDVDGDIDMDIRYAENAMHGVARIQRAAFATDGQSPVERLDGEATLDYDPVSGELAISQASLKGRYGGDEFLFSGSGGFRKALTISGTLETTLHAEALPPVGGISWTDGRVALDLTRLEADLSRKDWPLTALEGRILPDRLQWTMGGREYELDGPMDLVSASEITFKELDLVADGEEAELSGKITRNMASGVWNYELEAKAGEFTVDRWLGYGEDERIGYGEDERMGGGEATGREGDGARGRLSEGVTGRSERQGDGATGRQGDRNSFRASGTLTATVDRLHYKKATLKDVRVALGMLPGGEHLELSGAAFGGRVEAELDWPTGFPGVLDLRLENIAIDDALNDLENFEQDFILGDQVDGRATALATVTLPAIRENWADELEAEIAVQITDGRLRDMELMENFSRFVQLSELRNLSFSELINVFSWRNGTLFIPAMRIQSNVADLAIAGRHQTGKAFHYDIRVDGGSVLSKKSKKRKDLQSDREGWLQLYYHVEGDADDYSYRADKRHVTEALDASDGLRADVIRRLRERFGPDPLLIRTIEWRRIPEYQEELEGARRLFNF